jgi:hypothetical protein
MTRIIRFSIAAGVMTFLTGCDALEPYDRVGAWHPTAVNDANLAVMAVNPADLVYGRGTKPADGISAAAPIDRLRRDHVKPLPDNGSGSGASTSAAPSAAGLTSN